MSNKYARNVDLNQREIVKALRGLQCQVVLMHTVGGGFPDLIACRRGVAYFIEVKGSRGKLNAAQRTFHEQWRGPAIHIVRSVDDVVEVLKE